MSTWDKSKEARMQWRILLTIQNCTTVPAKYTDTTVAGELATAHTNGTKLKFYKIFYLITSISMSNAHKSKEGLKLIDVPANMFHLCMWLLS